MPVNPGLQKQRARQKEVRQALQDKDTLALEALGRWWVQDKDCLGESLLCHVLKRRHAWALERLLAVGVPVCWRTVRAASGKISSPHDLDDLRAVWPLLMPSIQSDALLRATLVQELVGQLRLGHVRQLHLEEVFAVSGWEEPLEFRLGASPFPRFTPLQWAIKKRKPALAEVFLSLGAAYDAASPESDWPRWTLKNDLETISASHAFWGRLVTALGCRVRAEALQESLPVEAARSSSKPRF